jgi:cyclopropane-fatty-acyl-phospholipid synthase
MLLQAITIDDRAYEVEKAGASFINTYIFPDGCLPSLEVIARCVGRRTDMRTVDLHDLTSSYAETLRRWRANFETRVDRAEELGYDERFQRLWRLYLSYCEAGFAERRIGVVQIMLAKPHHEPSGAAHLHSVAGAQLSVADAGCTCAPTPRRAARTDRERPASPARSCRPA